MGPIEQQRDGAGIGQLDLVHDDQRGLSGQRVEQHAELSCRFVRRRRAHGCDHVRQAERRCRRTQARHEQCRRRVLFVQNRSDRRHAEGVAELAGQHGLAVTTATDDRADGGLGQPVGQPTTLDVKRCRASHDHPRTRARADERCGGLILGKLVRHGADRRHEFARVKGFAQVPGNHEPAAAIGGPGVGSEQHDPRIDRNAIRTA